MSRKQNIIFNVIIYVVTLALFVLATVEGQRYTDNLWELILIFIIGSLIAMFLSTLFHELGHLIGGKINGFVFSSMTVWFLRWYKKGKKTRFSFCSFGGEAGYTEMIPTNADKVEKAFKKMTLSGVIFSLIPVALGVVPLFLTFLPKWVYCIWVMLLPIGAFSFLDNALPMIVDGVRNDGSVLRSIRKKDDSGKVMINLLKIQAELYQGKTPSEVDKNLYFDLPQIREDDFNFIALLNARYLYYLDMQDYENVLLVSERLSTLEEYLSNENFYIVKANALFNNCTFDFDSNKADEIVYELEKFLNSVNNVTNLRIKLAYILLVSKETELYEQFYKKAIKEASKCQISGLGKFETKLINYVVDLAKQKQNI